MSEIAGDRFRFDTCTGQVMRRCLRVCGYHDDLIEKDYEIGGGISVPVITFAHRPHDARSSCLAFLGKSTTPVNDLARLRELGAPLAFFVGEDEWEVWSLRSDGPGRVRSISTGDIEGYFESKREDFAPGAIFRAKTWARSNDARQLDFVDVGLLPMVETEAGARLRQLFEEMVAHTLDALGWESVGEADSHWLVKANFWLLAGKLLRDKQVKKFTDLDLSDVRDVFDRVAEHYDAPRVRTNGRLNALRGAATVAAKFASLRSISTETLGSLYEEALLSERTRKLLSVHRTPTYLVDYMIAKLSRWIEQDIGVENCHVFEPACGHSPFLVGAVRLLSDLLPEKIASDRAARRQFLRKHIAGCDRDPFALEIARLSLTLADIPNPNGWRLDPVKDMFTGDYLDKCITAASVILVNPPFESTHISTADRAGGDLRFHRNGQAAEMLRRLLRSAQPGTAFGVVLPQSILEGNWFTSLRRELLSQCEIREISLFPDKVFQFADVETAIVLGRKVEKRGSTRQTREFTFRRVREADMPRFASTYVASTNAMGEVASVEQTDDLCLVLPDLPRIWQFLAESSRLDSMANIGHGFIFLSPNDPGFPHGETTTSPQKAEGFVEGFANISGAPDTHLIPKKVWLNQKPSIFLRRRSGTQQGIAQIVLNHVRASRQAWRLKGFMDQVGLPVRGGFLTVRSKDSHWPLEIFWAICNSPLANAYTYAHSAKKNILSGFLRGMPAPDLAKLDSARLVFAVRAYFAAAGEYSERIPEVAIGSSSPRKVRRGAKTGTAGENLLFNTVDLEGSTAQAAARERLRALHWRVDAEVLNLYQLPAKLERELLDFFDGVRRVGVPFEQTAYIPLGFREVERLDEFLRITDEWDQTDARRCELIAMRIKQGSRTAQDEAEFQGLQRLFDVRRSYLRWQETGNAHGPLFDEKTLRQFQEDDD